MDIENIEDIEQKLDLDLKKHNKYKQLLILIVTLLLCFLLKGTIIYHIKFAFAFPNGYENIQINTSQEPQQIDYPDNTINQRIINYESLTERKVISLIPRASYKISALVTAHNSFFPVKDKMFDAAALYDIGLAWGELGDKDFYKKYFKSYTAKNGMFGPRLLWTEMKTTQMPVSEEYAKSHFSHSHLIPATRNIMAALLKIKDFQLVEIEGELVDMQYKEGNKTYSSHTSLSRSDTGLGACENIYVTKLKYRNKIYQ